MFVVATWSRNMYSNILVYFLVIIGCAVCARDKQREVIDIDLRQGHVKGQSEYVTFMRQPRASKRQNCDGRAVLRIDMDSPYQTVRVTLHYARPRLWTFHLADTLSDGYGGGPRNGSSLSTAEAHVVNKQLRIYSNQLPGYHDATINGGLLLKVANNVIDVNSSLTFTVSDERLEWEPRNKRKQLIESKFLHRLDAAAAAASRDDAAAADDNEDPHNDHFLYVGLNRIVSSDFRKGSGVCRATVVLIAEKSE